MSGSGLVNRSACMKPTSVSTMRPSNSRPVTNGVEQSSCERDHPQAPSALPILMQKLAQRHQSKTSKSKEKKETCHRCETNRERSPLAGEKHHSNGPLKLRLKMEARDRSSASSLGRFHMKAEMKAP